jgi:sterol desaturase/sphingolipid hydroxylase (fatty acid hydroxylase superfamily)
MSSVINLLLLSLVSTDEEFLDRLVIHCLFLLLVLKILELIPSHPLSLLLFVSAEVTEAFMVHYNLRVFERSINCFFFCVQTMKLA